MKKSQDIYMEPEVYHYDNCIVRVYRPILTEEERARRMEAIKKAAKEEMDAAVKYADESPYPDPSEVLDDVYTSDNERCVAR